MVASRFLGVFSISASAAHYEAEDRVISASTLGSFHRKEGDDVFVQGLLKGATDCSMLRTRIAILSL